MPEEQDTAQQKITNGRLTRSSKYRCLICHKQYKRREHLSRHVASSHTSERPFNCTSCHGSFQRGDVLKRHLRTCGGLPSKAGARRRACDRCVRQKKACSAEQPCQGCSKKGVLCFYSTPNSDEIAPSLEVDISTTVSNERLCGFDLSTSPAISLDLSNSGHRTISTNPPLDSLFRQPNSDYLSLDWPDYTQLASDAKFLDHTIRGYSLPFLLRFTSNTGLVLSFDCGTQEQREQVASALEIENFHAMQQISSFSTYPNTTASPTSAYIVDDLSDVNTLGCIPQNWLSDPLSLKTHEILLLIKEVVTVKPRNSPVTLEWTTALKDACLQFFSPANLRRYLGFYWAIWHPNVNFVHRPSFETASAKPALLAAMALMGACVSPDMPDNEDARMWLNCVEEIVFIDDDFNSDLGPLVSSSMTMHRPKLQALQAAYIVCLYQNWEGTDSSKSRIRRFRFANLVSTARDIGITSAAHPNYGTFVRADFQWKDFAAREELIRLFMWIFLLDTAFAIFNNLPPRMVFKEMSINMAVPEACFQAETADICHQKIQTYLPTGSCYWRFSFRRAFEALSQPELHPQMQQFIASLGPLNLFALASAIHSQIFQYRNSMSTCQSLVSIRHTLANWNNIWHLFSCANFAGSSPHILVEENDVQPSTMWKRNGFYRFCAEYWLLANLMADRLSISDSFPEDISFPGRDSILDPILSKYDQTSMRQVNDLIMGFQTFQI